MAQDDDTPEDDVRSGPTKRRWVRVVIVCLAAFLVVALAFSVFIGTQSGSNFVRDTINSQEFGEKLEIDVGTINGSLFETPIISNVVIRTFVESLSLIHISEPTRPY